MSDTCRWSESSFTPCTAALGPDAILRDKHSTVSDQNIIDWIPNIIYSSIRDVQGAVWSSRHQLYQASEHLVRFIWSHGQGEVEFALFFLLFHPYWRKWQYSPPEWRTEREEVLRGKILVFFTIIHILSPLGPIQPVSCRPHQRWGCGACTSARSLGKDSKGHLSRSWQSLFHLTLQPKVQGKRTGWQFNWTKRENFTSKGFLPQTVSVFRSWWRSL